MSLFAVDLASIFNSQVKNKQVITKILVHGGIALGDGGHGGGERLAHGNVFVDFRHPIYMFVTET